MKKVAIILFLFSFNLFSQDLKKVDKIIKSYPYINSIEKLAKKIDYDFNTKIEKIRATYTWLALNIEYYKEQKKTLDAPQYILYSDKRDLERRLKILKKNKNEKIISNTFTTRRGLCEGYALIFNKICDLLNIENQLIKGFVKTNPYEISYIPKNKNHIWNAVKLNNNWMFFDATFGAGYVLNGKWTHKLESFYFNIKKENLNQSHFPSEQKWLIHMNQKPLKLFSEKPVFSIPFLLTKAKLLSHKEGEIITNKREKIILKIKGLNPDIEISYSYAMEQNYQIAFSRNYSSYRKIVLNSPNKSANLNIYFNSKLALQYKVLVQ